MKTRTRTTTTTTETDVSSYLPAGFDDPDSPFYWPPEARERYRPDARADARYLSNEQPLLNWVAYYRGAREFDRRVANGASLPPCESDWEKARFLARLPDPHMFIPRISAAEVTDEETNLYLDRCRLGAVLADMDREKRKADAAARAAEDTRRRQGCQLSGCENLTTAWSGWPDRQLTATLTLKPVPRLLLRLGLAAWPGRRRRDVRARHHPRRTNSPRCMRGTGHDPTARRPDRPALADRPHHRRQTQARTVRGRHRRDRDPRRPRGRRLHRHTHPRHQQPTPGAPAMTNHLAHVPAAPGAARHPDTNDAVEHPPGSASDSRLRDQGSDVAPSRAELRQREDTGKQPTTTPRGT